MSVGRQRLLAGAATAVSQTVGLVGIAVFGVLIAAKFGSDARTDGFFLANSIYAIVLFIGQSLRSTTVAGIVHDERHGIADALTAVAVMAIGAIAVFVAAALLLMPVLTSGLNAAGTASARSSMLLLAPAAGLQLLSGVLAAILAARARYAVAAWAYTVGTLAALVLFALLASSLGIDAIPVALLAGTATTTATLIAAVARDGRPALERSRGARQSVRMAAALLLGSAGLIGAQLVVASSTAFAARIGVHQATVYSYSVMALSLIMAAAVTPANIVFAPVIAREWRGDTADLAIRAIRTFRFGCLFVVPLVALLFVVGPEPAAALLAKLQRAQIDELLLVALILSPSALATLAAVIPELALLTTGRFRTVATIAATGLGVHLTVTAVVVAAGGRLPAVAAVSALTATGIAVAATMTAAGPDRWTLLRGYATGLAELVAVPACAYALMWLLLARGHDVVMDMVAFALATALAVAWLLTTQRTEMADWLDLIRPRRT